MTFVVFFESDSLLFNLVIRICWKIPFCKVNNTTFMVYVNSSFCRSTYLALICGQQIRNTVHVNYVLFLSKITILFLKIDYVFDLSFEWWGRYIKFPADNKDIQYYFRIRNEKPIFFCCSSFVYISGNLVRCCAF